jgi:hypothetical protein
MARKPTASPKLSAEDKRWRAENALQTLTRAEQIRADSALMADVKKYAQDQVKTLSKVAGATPDKTPTSRRK